MTNTGYSGTPLGRKLGLKNGFKIKLVNVPDYYFDLFPDLPEDLLPIDDSQVKKDFIHYFARNISQLNQDISSLANELEQNGMLWISWPKKSSKLETDLNGNLVRESGLQNGLVDIKVCAIDEIWSGLKFVIPVKNRK